MDSDEGAVQGAGSRLFATWIRSWPKLAERLHQGKSDETRTVQAARHRKQDPVHVSAGYEQFAPEIVPLSRFDFQIGLARQWMF